MNIIYLQNLGTSQRQRHKRFLKWFSFKYLHYYVTLSVSYLTLLYQYAVTHLFAPAAGYRTSRRVISFLSRVQTPAPRPSVVTQVVSSFLSFSVQL